MRDEYDGHGQTFVGSGMQYVGKQLPALPMTTDPSSCFMASSGCSSRANSGYALQPIAMTNGVLGARRIELRISETAPFASKPSFVQ